ncbi:MAG: cbb3-type cytochrome c oxidase subunit I [Acidimicrobiaceae bacterium]|nr:cbb3-type cytochrome c oxidase subunit I [Acidimicrobiaceae bacterium]
MTLTDSPVAESEAAADAVGAAAPASPAETIGAPRGLAQPFMTNDAAQVGRLFVISSLLLGLGTAAIGVLLSLGRTDAVAPDDLFGGLNAYFRMWTLYRVSFLLLVVMPLLLGLAMAVMPAQVGAGNAAFPRAALASFWSWKIGAVIVVASVLAGGGWGALDGVTGNESDAMALTLLGTGIMIVGLLLGAIVVATTVISLRRTGMSLLDVPPFSWSVLVTAVVWLLSLPVAIANIVVIYADLRGRPAIAFGRPESPDIWLQLDWLVEQPAVYAMAVPVLGIIFTAAGAAVGARSSRPEAMLIVVGLFGLLAMGGWSQDYFTAPQDLRDGLVYVAFGLAAVVPVVATAGGVGELAMRGSKTLDRLLDTRMLGAGAALKLLGAAALVGALRVIEPLDLLETSATWAVFHGVVVAGLVAAVAALATWPQLLFGPIQPRLARGAIVLLFGGGGLLVLADLASGFIADDPDLMALALDGSAALNVVALIGSLLVAAGLSVALFGVASALKPSAADTPEAAGSEPA